MTDEEFYQFIEDAMGELNQKQELLQKKYGLGAYSRWFFDQATEKLQFLSESGTVMVEADVIDIGSFSTRSNTWKWAWSNSSNLPLLREKAMLVKELEAYTGREFFGYEMAFELDDMSMAWEFAAMAIKYLGALGCYRAPTASGDLFVFLAITEMARK